MIFLVVVLNIFSWCHAAHNSSVVDLDQAVKKIIQVSCIVLHEDSHVYDITNQLKELTELTGQMMISLNYGDQPISKESIKEDACGALCVLYCAREKVGNTMYLSCRLYDSREGTMIGGQRCALDNVQLNCVVQQIAAWLWQTLFNDQGPFGSYIAYIAAQKVGNTKRYSLCMRSWDGSDEPQILFSTSQPLVCPVWNTSLMAPSIIYSEFTSRNVRLMMINLQGSQRIVIDQDGTFAGVSYPVDGDYVVYCRSGDVWRFAFDKRLMKSTHRLLIREDEPCASPQITRTGDIIYCCKGRIKLYHTDDEWSEFLTHEGYAVGPSYSLKNNAIVFSKKNKGILQLWSLSLDDGKMRQLTHDSGNKMDPVWSPCGRWIAYAQESKGKQTIMIFNWITGKQFALIPVDSMQEEADCYCPTWSTYRCF